MYLVCEQYLSSIGLIIKYKVRFHINTKTNYEYIWYRNSWTQRESCGSNAICSAIFKACSVHCHGRLTSCGVWLTPPHWHAFQPAHQHCPLWLYYSHQLRLLGSQRTHRTVSCWAALIETAYVLSQAKWVEGGGEMKKKTDKTLHQSVVAEQLLSCDQVVGSHTHAYIVHFTCTVFYCAFCYEYSRVIRFLITVPKSRCFCNWVTRKTIWRFSCSFGVVNDQCGKKTNMIHRHKLHIPHTAYYWPHPSSGLTTVL